MNFTSISIKERNDPLAIAMKYTIENLGINIRPVKCEFDETSENYLINLNAVIPNEISPIKKSKKSIIFIFENIGNLILDKHGNIIKKELAENLESKIYTEFWKIHKKLDDIIKKFGEKKWGEFSYVKWFFQPFYSILNEIMNYRDISKSQLKNEELWKYIIPLLDNDFLIVDPQNSNKLILSNSTKALIDKYDDIQKVSNLIIGMIISNSTDYITNDLNLSGILSYIDVPKIYYLDAIEYGEMINISYIDLKKKYRQFGRKIEDNFKRDMGFKNLLTQLASAEFLNVDLINDRISGNEVIYNEAIKYRDEILENANIFIGEV